MARTQISFRRGGRDATQGVNGQAPGPAGRPPPIKFSCEAWALRQIRVKLGALMRTRPLGGWMNLRLTLTLAALGAALAGCTSMPKVGAVVTQPEVALSPDNP